MTQGGMPLSTHVAVFKQVRDRIAAEFGLDDDDAAVLDTTEGETDLADYLARLMREARAAEAQAKGMADLQKQMAERKARLVAKHDRIKSIVLHAMADAGLPKLTAPDFTATRGRSQPGVVVTSDAALIPDHLCRISREADKTKIRKALKGGAAFDFAYLGNGAETLTIRGS